MKGHSYLSMLQFLGVTGTRVSWNKRFTVSKIRRVVSVAFLVPLSSTISGCLILLTADLALSSAGRAAASSLSACSFSMVMVFFCSMQASVTALTSWDLMSAFLFSTSSVSRSLAVASTALLRMTSSFLRLILSSSTPAVASASLSRPQLMFCSSTSMPLYLSLYTSWYMAMNDKYDFGVTYT